MRCSDKNVCQHGPEEAAEFFDRKSHVRSWDGKDLHSVKVKGCGELLFALG
jgi:hypothetical protein